MYCSCCRSNDWGSSGCLRFGLLDCGSGCSLRSRRSNLLSGGRFGSWVLQGCNRLGLIDLRGVLIDLGGDGVLSLGFRLEKFADTSRKTTADFGGVDLLLLFLLLIES